jgi:ornithine carbamoyltransferase
VSDGIVIRTWGSDENMRTFASQKSIGVINAMTENENPTQTLADITAMRQYYSLLPGLRVLYLGEENNTASALALSLPRFSGTQLFFCTSLGYGMTEQPLMD